ncbi:MAG: hypothetical protein IKM33_05550 [Clostridia bacterium]|nr:hypothetical protein [Clostridia bacterium]
MDELKKRKTPRYQGFNYNCVGIYFLTICTQNRRCILSRIVGTGVLDCPQTELTKYGKIAEKYIRQLNEFYHHLSVEKYVIMPNHIHLLLWVKENNTTDNGQSGTPIPTMRGKPPRTSSNGQSGTPVTDGQSGTPVTDGQSGTPVTDGQSGTPVPTNIERANSACSQFVSTFKRFCNKEYGENIWQARFHDHIIRNRDDYEEHVKYIYENPLRWYYNELYTEE